MSIRCIRNLATVTLLLAAVALAGGCSDPAKAGTENATECVKNNLIEQCPPGSDPKLDSQASSKCEASGEANLITESGSVTGSCVGEGSCQVLCQFSVPCDCGVDRITDEGVFCSDCNDAAACGNGECEPTEDPEACPSDCGMQCTPDKERCNGNDREICGENGRWETVECGDNESCEPVEDEEDVTECVRDGV